MKGLVMTDHQHSGDRTATGAGASLDFGSAVFGTFAFNVTNAGPDTVSVLETSPDGTVWTARATVTGQRSAFIQGTGINARYARINVTTLGTPPGGKVGAVIKPQ
jgi:hypothetical protein